MKKSTNYLVQAALIAGLYSALTYGQNFLFPGSTSMSVQFRISEALTLLAVFTPAAIPGLTIGCLISNIINITILPFDVLLGSLATLISAFAMYMLRNVKLFKLPILAALMPAIFNGLIIGMEIEIFFIKGPFNIVSFLIQGGLVALGELCVCLILGLPLVSTINKTKIFEKLNRKI